MQYKKQLRRHKLYLLSTYQSHKFYGGVCRVGRGWPTNDYILEKNVRHKYISKPRYVVIYKTIDQWFWYKCRFVPWEAAVKYKHERRTFRDKLWLITEYFLYVNESMSCDDMPQNISYIPQREIWCKNNVITKPLPRSTIDPWWSCSRQELAHPSDIKWPLKECFSLFPEDRNFSPLHTYNHHTRTQGL